MEFCNDRFVSDYIADIKARLKAEVGKLSNGDIERTRRKEWVELFVSKSNIEAIVLFPDNSY